jgi:hypothetical protein
MGKRGRHSLTWAFPGSGRGGQPFVDSEEIYYFEIKNWTFKFQVTTSTTPCHSYMLVVHSDAQSFFFVT